MTANAFSQTRRGKVRLGVFASFFADANDPNNNTIIPLNGGNPTHFYDGYTNPVGGELDAFAFVFGGRTDPLDGTAPENRQFISSTQPTTWAPGEYLILRWFDNADGTPAMLALNDLQIEAHASAARAPSQS